MVPGKTVAEVLPELEAFLAKRGLHDFPVLLYDADELDGLNDFLDLPGPIPCTIALDAEGREVDREEGAADAERFREMMRKALGLSAR